MGDVRWLDLEEQVAWRAVLGGSIRLVDQLDKELRSAHGLSLADYEILVHLSEAPDRRLRMADLADAALLSRSRLTHRVDRLVARGDIVREPCPTDKRGWFAVLTDAGFGRLVEAAPTHVEGVRTYLVDPLTRDALVDAAVALGAVTDAVERSRRG